MSKLNSLHPGLRGLIAGVALAAMAQGAPFGVATANGDFKVDNTLVRGSATLREGTLVEAASVEALVKLANGARFVVREGGRARVYSDRVVLEQGRGDLAAGSYRVEAKGMTFAPGEPGSRASFAIRDAAAVQVAATFGRIQARNLAGMLISNIDSGSALEFEPQAQGGAALPSSFFGCVLKKDGKFVIYDQTTRMIVELRSSVGVEFAGHVGNRVQANGTSRAAANGAQTLDVSTVSPVETGGCSTVAEAIGADPMTAARPETKAAKPAPTKQAKAPKADKPAPAPKVSPAPKSPGSGMSAGTKIAIVALVGGGGAVAAVAATSGKGDSRSR